METFTAIFTQLGVDSSLMTQFLIIMVVFIIVQFLFLGKLQHVIETREEKTTKLENSANDTVEKVQKMQSEYKIKVDEANRNGLKSATDKKQNVTQKYTDQFKQAEKEINGFVDQSRNEFSKEVASNKETYLAEADTLAKSFVQKILQ